MEWGEQEEFLEKIWKETGIIPAALSGKPEMDYWMLGYMKAFWVLCGRRSYGMGPNPISFQDIVMYHEMYEFDDFDEFQTLICGLDEKWLSVMASRKPK